MALSARTERWPLAQAFTISRGSKSEAVVVVVEVSDGHVTGRGECVPYARYNENVESVVLAIDEQRGKTINRIELQSLMPAGAARNALDCALWDFEAKRTGKRAYTLADISEPTPIPVTFTISLDSPEKMAEAAKKEATRPILKIKLGGENDGARIAAVRQAAPKTRLIVDANEGWTVQNLSENLSACAEVGVELIEQPLPAHADQALATIKHHIPICADESLFDRASLAGLKGKYDMINIKLDKAGGLTEALALADAAKKLGLTYMVGCMVCTSLAIAPAFLIARDAVIADLDGALLLAHDRPEGMAYAQGRLMPPKPELWG